MMINMTEEFKGFPDNFLEIEFKESKDKGEVFLHKKIVRLQLFWEKKEILAKNMMFFSKKHLKKDEYQRKKETIILNFLNYIARFAKWQFLGYIIRQCELKYPIEQILSDECPFDNLIMLEEKFNVIYNAYINNAFIDFDIEDLDYMYSLDPEAGISFLIRKIKI